MRHAADSGNTTIAVNQGKWFIIQCVLVLAAQARAAVRLCLLCVLPEPKPLLGLDSEARPVQAQA